MDPVALGKYGIKPIIHEIIRTEVIFPRIVLLVEHAVVQECGETEAGVRQQAFRVYLTDGEYRIQGVMRRRLHKTLIQSDVGRGSVIILKDYKIAMAKRLNAEGRVLHFVIMDFLVIGHQGLPEPEVEATPPTFRETYGIDGAEDGDENVKNETMLDELIEEIKKDSDGTTVGDQEVSEPPRPRAIPWDQSRQLPAGQSVNDPVDKRASRRIGSKRKHDQPPRSASTIIPNESRMSRRLVNNDQPPTKIRPNLLSVEHEPHGGLDDSSNHQDQHATQMGKTLPGDLEWVRRATIEHHQRCHLNIEVPESQRVPASDGDIFRDHCIRNPLPNDGNPCESACDYSLRAIMDGTPLRSFTSRPRIVPLASVTGKHKSRNQDVDVLAVIIHVDASTTKPAVMPLKRDIRIQDPTVDEAVTVSVFMDPANFQPSVGTIALLRHVTTHDWKKGNLNAYPARVKGREWYVPNPQCFGLREEVSHVETWWRDLQPQ